MIAVLSPASYMVWRVIGWTENNIVAWMEWESAKGTIRPTLYQGIVLSQVLWD